MQMTKRNSVDRKFKRDALKLTEGPHLAGYVIQHSDTYRLLIIDGAIMRFTPTEYALLLRLLQHCELQSSQCLNPAYATSTPQAVAVRIGYSQYHRLRLYAACNAPGIGNSASFGNSEPASMKHICCECL